MVVRVRIGFTKEDSQKKVVWGSAYSTSIRICSLSRLFDDAAILRSDTCHVAKGAGERALVTKAAS
jgi:hypothetical protein